MNTHYLTRIRFLAPLLAASLALSAASPAFGEIFRTVDAQGNISYTDQPPRPGDTQIKSEQIEISKTNTFQDSTPYERWDPDVEEGADNAAPTSYSLAIVSPTNDASIRNNAGNVVVRTQIAPDLASGHVARLELDGTLTSEAVESGSIYLTNVSRGTHQARLVVESETGRRLAESAESVFHLQRISVFSPNRPTPPAGPPPGT